MYTTAQLMKIFSKSDKFNTSPDTEQISNIIQFVDVESGVLSNGIDYYFRISLLNLVKSGISDETILGMAQNGWSLSKDKKFIEFIY